jgi:hypothetical protein
MSGAPRKSDKQNTISIVVVGVCSAALVYISIAFLQAYYANDIADVQTIADYGGQDKTAQSLKAAQLNSIGEYVNKMGTPQNPASTHQVPIDRAMELVVAEAKTKPSNLVPAVGPAVTPTVEPIFGRPKPLAPTAPPTPAPAAGSAGSASAPAPAAGSAAPVPAAAGSATPTPAPAGNGR